MEEATGEGGYAGCAIIRIRYAVESAVGSGKGVLVVVEDSEVVVVVDVQDSDESETQKRDEIT